MYKKSKLYNLKLQENLENVAKKTKFLRTTINIVENNHHQQTDNSFV